MTALLVEGATRALLFADLPIGWRMSQRLRRPGRYGRHESDDIVYAIRLALAGADQVDTRPPWSPYHDDRVGWTSYLFAPPDYRHVDEAGLRGRRPVLLFGDSFAACSSKPEITCFQTLLDGTELGEELALLNYGVPGHGLDQSYLLLGPVLDRHAARLPIVLVGLFMDDGLDRCLLGVRTWPKPRLREEHGDLVLPTVPVPTATEYLRGDNALPLSYAWAYWRGARLDRSVSGTPAQEAEKQRLGRALLRAIAVELRSRGTPFCFVLFNGADSVGDPSVLSWRQGLVREELRALSAPWVEVREDILERAAREGRPLGDFFFPGDFHMNALGNETALWTLLRGLAVCGVHPPPPPLWVPEIAVDEPGGGFVRFQDRPSRYNGDPDAGVRLLLRGGTEPTRLSYRLDGRCDRFEVEARAICWEGSPCSLSLQAVVDGESRWASEVQPDGSCPRLVVDLREARTLELLVAQPSESPPACYLVLSGLAFD